MANHNSATSSTKTAFFKEAFALESLLSTDPSLQITARKSG